MQTITKQIAQTISATDPGFLALKRSAKTFIAILISLLAFWSTPGMAMFAAISSMLFSRSQAGFTIAERRFTMLATGLTMVVLSVPVSLLSQNDYLALGFVVVASLITFFLIGSRIVPDFPAISVLALSVVEMAFSHTLASGIQFSVLFMMTTTLVYILHFVIWPTRPQKRLRAQIDIILKNTEDYKNSIIQNYPDLEAGMQRTRETSDRLRKSIGDFRRLWQLFRINPLDNKGIEMHYLEIYRGLEKIQEFMLLWWQFRAGAWHSESYHQQIIQNKTIIRIIDKLLSRHHPNVIKASDVELQNIINEIKTLNLAYLNQFKTISHNKIHDDRIATLNTLKALETLARDLQNTDDIKHFELQEFSPSAKLESFFREIKKAPSNLRANNFAFRLGIRSAIIIGATMAYARFFEPQFGYWLVLFAVLLIRPNLGISIKAGKERLLGTIAGSLLALAFVWLVPVANPVYYFFLFLSLFAMLWYINLNRMVPMVTALTFMIVGLFYLLYPQSSNLIWLRIFYTFSIVMLVIVASFLLWPEKARGRFADALARALTIEQNYFDIILHTLITSEKKTFGIAERQKFRDSIQALNEVIDATKNEVLQQKVIVHGLNIRSYILRLINTLQSLDAASQQCLINPEIDRLNSRLSSFSQKVNMAFDALIMALENRDAVKYFPDLQKEFEILQEDFKSIASNDSEMEKNIDQYWKNSTFVWNLKPLILELEGIKKEINMKISEG